MRLHPHLVPPVGPLGMVGLTTVALLAVLVTDAAAHMIPTHMDITNCALNELKWNNQRAGDILKQCNAATDIADLLEGGVADQVEGTLGLAVCPNGTVDHLLEVQHLASTATFNHYPYQTDPTINMYGTHGSHFDNMDSWADCNARWSALRAWIQQQVPASWDSVGQDRFMCAMGMVLHAVQDFYCHSDYVLIVGRYGATPPSLDPSTLPTWDELYAQGGCNGRRPLGSAFPTPRAL